MLSKYKIFTIILWLSTISLINAQNNCGSQDIDTSGYVGSAFFNYGSTAKAKNSKFKMQAAVGQTLTGFQENNEYSTNLGFYSRLLLPPFKLKVSATQGDLLDRIQVTWQIDALGPSPNGGFNIYRDNVFLATVGSNIRNYNDFNVIAGIPYTYTVRGINIYGEGTPSEALGFQVPNGVVTGWVRTKSGGSVPDALVTLMPMQGFALKFGALDGATAPKVNNNPYLPPSGTPWTMTFWIKTNTASANSAIVHLSPLPMHIRALPSASNNEGIEVATSDVGNTIMTSVFPDSTKNGWHHIALSWSEGISRLYIDGILKNQATLNPLGVADTLFMGSKAGLAGWDGLMDEFRIYHRQLDELDLVEVMEGTASSQTAGLSHYWKMDEELGEKSYDIKKRQQLYFCGARFDIDRPPVRTAGKTNSQGYYRIESASYGTGTTFLAEPMKSFYLNKSVRLNRSQNANISIPNFAIPRKSTIEVVVNTAGATGIQTILSKKSDQNDFKVFLDPVGIDQELKIMLNGTTQSFGILGSGFQHLAITLDSVSNDVQVYKNGISLGTQNFSGTMGNLAEGSFPWRLGAYHDGNMLTDYFNGLIDEIAVYDTILSAIQINQHVQQTRDIQEKGLYVYFPMNEGAGNRISNTGSRLLDFGTLTNAEWSSFAANQVTEPHVFSPKTRQVTLNPSVTSVDQVDFIDNSTVPVSGYVRYKNTDCFAQNVEILVNNTRFNPPIFTDSTGRFVIDFDPGASARLTPKLEDHVFMPAFWDVSNVNSPRSGIVFNDVTVRRVSGIIAGGSNPTCKKSIMREPVGDFQNQGTVCRVQVRSVDGCFVRTITIDNVEGEYDFEGLPPLERMTVAVTSHSDNDIRTAFQVQGGSTVNLLKRDTTINFIYVAPPIPEISSGLDPFPGCSPEVIVMDKGESKTINIRLKEVYEGGACYLDTARFNIINGFSDVTLDTIMSGTSLQYSFRVGSPNPSPPYLKTLQIIGTTEAGRKGSLVTQAVITGTKEKLPSFTTKLPERPFLVLHDPPGDGSYAFLEKDSSVCYTTGINISSDITADLTQVFNLVPKITANVGFGYSVQTEFRPIVGGSLKLGTTYSRVTDSTFQTCLQTSQRISTDDGDLIVGGDRGGDVFMGTAQNIIFANVDEVTFDNCIVNVVESVEVSPGDFATTFIYSEFNIRNYVIPNLQKLLANPNTTAADSIAQSIARWQSILANNDARKAKAKSLKNISFDAGASYEYSETTEVSNSNSISTDTVKVVDGGFITGFFANDLGSTFNVGASYSATVGRISENKTQYGNTIGYVLKDDDPGDFFSIDIGIDSAYLTPTFKLRAGQSSCPWEPGTANREKPNLQIVPNADGTEAFSAIDVPANESAVFNMLLGNGSATNEDWTYGFTAIAGSNPDGAIIKLNGQPLNNNTIQYIVPYGTSIPITLTVDRGPVAFEYNNLQVALVSECEMARNFALSLPLDHDEKFFSSINLGVDFIRPCSEVKINVPEQNWVVINNDPEQPGTKRLITVSRYDLNAPDFQRIKLQYRPSNGNGTWINMVDTFIRYNPKWSGFAALPLPKPPVLRPDFTQFVWETAGIADGNYEIRAVAECTGVAKDKPGFSEIIRGRIDRQPPSLIGRPQPSDGVYHVGDEISFTFNKHINCSKINPVDDVLLIDRLTGLPLEIEIRCFENKIIIEPNNLNKFYENRTLRIELHNIEDLVGNTNIYEQWEFYVDRNELAWLKDTVSIVKYDDEVKSVKVKMHNRGGYPVPYTIHNIPAWMSVYPKAGSLVANETVEITIEVSDDVPLGNYYDSIILRTETGINPFFMGGDEPLVVNTRVICRPPVWVINPAAFDASPFDFSMNYILKLNIEGSLSTDTEDMVGAYVNGALRGVSKVQYKPGLGYVAFLTVYSNVTSGETVDFQIWDASDCQLYADIIESFPYVFNTIVGSVNAPQVIHTSGKLLRKIYLKKGWNWISLNLDPLNPDINATLQSLSNPAGATIKNQAVFSQYSMEYNIWGGFLTTLGPGAMYQYYSQVKDSLSVIGTHVDSLPIPIKQGWNWIGYVPTYKLPINTALSSLQPTQGDIIKGQLTFAVYDAILGWVGNLTYMDEPHGYLLKSNAVDTLIYPNLQNRNAQNEGNITNMVLKHPLDYQKNPEIEGPIISRSKHWELDPSQYEHNMNVIAFVVDSEDRILLKENDELGLFVQGELRGTGRTMYIPGIDKYILFVTVYANRNGEQIDIKYYSAAEDKVFDIEEKMTFNINDIIGAIDSPALLHLAEQTTSSLEDILDDKLKVYPNPFSSGVTIEWQGGNSHKTEIKVTNSLGESIEVFCCDYTPRATSYVWKPDHNISAGTYIVQVKTPHEVIQKKVIFIK